MRARQIVAPAIAILVVLAATACAGGNSSTTPAPRTITANAVGKAEGTPDLVTITIGVQTQAPKARTALSDNNTKAAAVIAKLKSAGVADKDIQTAQLSLNPTYRDGPTPTISGYQVSNLVTAKLRHLGDAGSVIDAAAAVAGDDARVEGISFSIADDSSLLARARADAVQQAVSRAKTMARAAGVTLGRLRSITDVLVQQPRPFTTDSAASAGASAAAVPVQPGTQELSVEVAVIYDIA
jgi:uncharacterized protein YggE